MLSCLEVDVGNQSGSHACKLSILLTEPSLQLSHPQSELFKLTSYVATSHFLCEASKGPWFLESQPELPGSTDFFLYFNLSCFIKNSKRKLVSLTLSSFTSG